MFAEEGEGVECGHGSSRASGGEDGGEFNFVEVKDGEVDWVCNTGCLFYWEVGLVAWWAVVWA